MAGSVRLVYAVIFSLFLGFGITIGTSFFGGIYSEATSALTCQNSLPLYKYFWMVPLFTIFLIIANQGRVNQMPMMVITSCVGFAINHFSSRRFSSNAQISNTLGALGIGFIANLYSRFFHGLAAATLLPAIFVQVPSGLAAGGSLISGVTSANRITNHTSSNTTVNGTAPVDGMTQGIIDMDINTMVFNVGFSMIQVAIGIAVGLSLSALVLYPCGKKRSALFSF